MPTTIYLLGVQCPAGNITTIDRLKRLQDIESLTEQGKGVYE